MGGRGSVARKATRRSRIKITNVKHVHTALNIQLSINPIFYVSLLHIFSLEHWRCTWFAQTDWLIDRLIDWLSDWIGLTDLTASIIPILTFKSDLINVVLASCKSVIYISTCWCVFVSWGFTVCTSIQFDFVIKFQHFTEYVLLTMNTCKTKIWRKKSQLAWKDTTEYH